MASETLHSIVCPTCDSSRIAWSKTRGFERMLRFFCLARYRCLECNARFWGMRKWGKEQAKVMYMAFLMFALVAFCWLCLKFFQPGRAPLQ